MSNRAVIYARYSSHNQREQSIEDQVNACREYADKNNMEVVNVYADYAKTGTNDNREAFQQMLYDSQKDKFDVVLVWKTDRFGRDRQNILSNRYILKKNNVELISITEYMPEGPERVIVEAIIDAMAEYYSKNLSQNIKRGLESNAKKGLINGGPVPIGYKSKDRHYIIDEETAFIPQLIFYLADNGYNYKEIVEYLKKEEIKTRKGHYFNINAVIRLLTNRKYIGEYYYSGVYYGKIIPPLVDEDLFFRVNEKLNARKRTRTTKDDDDFLLSGKVKCGVCGADYVADSGTSKTGAVYKYYKCNVNKYHKDNKKCSNKTVRKDFLEDRVLQIVISTLTNDDFLVKLSEYVIESADEDENDNLNLLRKNLANNKNKLSNLLELAENGKATSTIIDRISALEEENVILENKIKQEEFLSPDLTKEDVLEFFREIKNELLTQTDKYPVALRRIVESVVIYPDQIVVNFRSHDKTGNNLSKSSTYSQMVERPSGISNLYVSYTIISVTASLNLP